MYKYCELKEIIPSEPKKMNKTFSYNFGCLAIIIRLLFNPLNALWLWYRRKKFVIFVYFKMAERQSSESFCTSSCGKQSEWGRKPCRSVSHNRQRDKEAHERRRSCQQMYSSGRKTVMGQSRASGGLNKNRIITSKQPEL